MNYFDTLVQEFRRENENTLTFALTLTVRKADFPVKRGRQRE